MRVEFRAATADDLQLVHAWLQRPHVKRWWRDRETYEEVVEHYLPSIEGRDPTDHHVIVLDGEPAGFIQTYLVSDYPDWQRLTGVEDGVAGVDLFLANEDQTGHGIGTAVLDGFVRDVVFATPATIACVADPDSDNVASLRAFEKAGFFPVRQFRDPDDGRIHTLVRRERQSTPVTA